MRTCRIDNPDRSSYHTAMRSMGRSKGNRLKDGLFVGLLAYVLLVQGLAMAFATTLAATDQFDPMFVLCAPSGQSSDHRPVDPLERIGQDCCVALCKAAGSVGPAIEPASADRHGILPIVAKGERLPPGLHLVSPGALGITKEARAPPSLSV